ncbi:hypothetical protein KPL35_15800 [Clostridium sp. CF011]|uniref:hypothetical protein n=1 Tax=Clostridium sp. CF011 TaxID=2843318 RepID=UPI001C0C0C7B|nr:hypothetical protein [Clostridium sp. CF011]MBU3093522.1 hypothetical protein [Clostridium sp. CF011]WAG71741.1 hypothetical protein LL036_18390 [Clostridium sp. CF011]
MFIVNKKNEQLIQSLLYEVLVIFIIAILRFINIIDTLLFAIVIGSFSIWPIMELIKMKIKKNDESEINSNKLDVKISIITWLILSVFLLVFNYVFVKDTFWAVYPIIGIALWPVTIFIKFYFNKKNK